MNRVMVGGCDRKEFLEMFEATKVLAMRDVRINNLVRRAYREIPDLMRQAIGGHIRSGIAQPPNAYLQKWCYQYCLELWHAEGVA